MTNVIDASKEGFLSNINNTLSVIAGISDGYETKINQYLKQWSGSLTQIEKVNGMTIAKIVFDSKNCMSCTLKGASLSDQVWIKFIVVL